MESLYESVRASVLEKGLEIESTCAMDTVTIPTLKDFTDIVGNRLNVNIPFDNCGFISGNSRALVYKANKKDYTALVCIPLHENVSGILPAKINPTKLGSINVGYTSFSVYSEHGKLLILLLMGTKTDL